MVRSLYNQLLLQFYALFLGVGGISSGTDAYDKIKAGASMIQLYTSLIYQGPPIVNKVKRELTELLKSDGYSNISQAIGKNVT